MPFGKATEAIWGDQFCKRCIRGLIPTFLPVLSMEPWLRNEDPSLNGKRNFCYCLSTELIQLSISSVVGYFLHVCLLIGSVDSTGREIGITLVTCTCIIKNVHDVAEETNILSFEMLRLMYAHTTVVCKGCQFLEHLFKDE